MLNKWNKPIEVTEEARKAFKENQRKALSNYFLLEKCYFCKGDVIKKELERGNDGSKIVTGCPYCSHSFVD